MAATQHGRSFGVRDGRLGASSRSGLLGSILLALVLALAGTVEAMGPHCPATNFTARCTLRNGAGTFVSPDNQYKSCIPKTCGDYYHVENGVVTGSPASYGESVTITCNTGYTLSGPSTSKCTSSCEYEGEPPQCVPVTCPGTQPENAEAVPPVDFGSPYTVHCLEGFKAQQSVVTFGNPCATTITATCSATGTLSLSDTCVPVTCPPYDPNHHTLQCTDPSVCHSRSVVARMVPHMESVAYGEKVRKVCDAGYVLSGSVDGAPNAPTEYATCSATCQYTENQQRCVPDTCGGFRAVHGCIRNRPSNNLCDAAHDPATVTSSSAPYLGNVTVTCGSGGEPYGQTVLTMNTWSNCGTQAVSFCDMNNPVLVFNGTAMPVSGSASKASVTFSLGSGTPSLWVDDSFVGMHFNVGGTTRMVTSYTVIIPGETGEVELSGQVTLSSAGVAFNVTSVWNPPQTDIACFPRNDACDNGPSTVNIGCKDGERAVTPGLAYACATGAPNCTEQSEVTNYQKECQTCDWYHSLECRPVQCTPHTPGANEEPVDPMLFGEVLTVPCSVGYRASTSAPTEADRGVANSLPSHYELTCGQFEGGAAQEIFGNDRVLRNTSAARTCEIVSCGLFQMPMNASVYVAPVPTDDGGGSSNSSNASRRGWEWHGSDEDGEYDVASLRRDGEADNATNATDGGDTDGGGDAATPFNISRPVIHGDSTFKIVCDPGFRVDSSTSNFTHACSDSFTVSCIDGHFMYGHGDDTPSMIGIPACVPITCGITYNDTCGSEHCHPLSDLDHFANVTAIPADYVESGGSQVVTCKEGYRAGAATSVLPQTCDMPMTYSRDCSYCTFDPQPGEKCLPVRCDYTGSFGTPSHPYAAYNNSIVITCHEGYRPSNSGPVNLSTGADHSNMNHTMTCGPSCQLSSHSSISCQPVMCTLPTLPNAGAQGRTNMTYHEDVEFHCDAGYKLEYPYPNSTFEGPCEAIFHAICMADGHVMFLNSSHDLVHAAPRCVPIQGCSVSGGDVCGNEGCSASIPDDENGYFEGPLPAGTTHLGNLEVHCNTGYAASDEMSWPMPDGSLSTVPAFTSCTMPPSYNLTCIHCNLMNPTHSSWMTACGPKVCSSHDLQNGEWGGWMESSIYGFPVYGSNATVECNDGFRAANTHAAPPASAPRHFDVTCNASCGFSMNGFECRRLRCPAPSFTVAHATRRANQVEPLHDGTLGYSCDAGWRYARGLDLVTGECSADFNLTCDDGVYVQDSQIIDDDNVDEMPEGAALVCRPITCPAIDPHLHPSAALVVPAPAPETHAVVDLDDFVLNFTLGYEFTDGATHLTVTVVCDPGHRVENATQGGLTSLYSSPSEYDVNCTRCMWDAPPSQTCVPAACPAISHSAPWFSLDPEAVESVSCPVLAGCFPVAEPDAGGNGTNSNGTNSSRRSLSDVQDIAAFGDHVTVTCKEGYSANGVLPRVEAYNVSCEDHGWDSQSTSCLPVPCPAFVLPPQAQFAVGVSGSGRTFGDIVTYSCPDSMHVQGQVCGVTAHNVTCGPDGHWEGVASCLLLPADGVSCVHTDPYATPDDGSRFNNTVNATAGNASVGRTYTCKSGAGVLPHFDIGVADETEDGTEVTICADDVSMSYRVNCSKCAAIPDGQCAPLACPQADWLSQVTHSTLFAPHGPIQVGDHVIVHCDEGYRAGSDQCTETTCPASAPRELAMLCRHGGGNSGHCGYSAQGEECKIVSCPKFVLPPNTEALGPLTGGTYGDMFAYRCKPGHVFVDDIFGIEICIDTNLAECMEDGTWDARGCVPTTCPAPILTQMDNIASMSPMFPQELAFNESLDITCRYGYRLAETPVCNGPCTFSHEAYCEPVQCEIGDGEEHGPDTGFNDSETIESINTPDPHFGLDQVVTCKPGHMADGAWDEGGGFYRGKCSSTFVRECKGDGNLTNTDVRCVVAQCPSRYEAFPPHTLGSIVENGHIDIGDDHDISYYSKVTGCGMPMPNMLAGSPSAFTSPPVTIVCDRGYQVAYSNGTKLSPETNTKELCCGGDPERGMCEWPNARDYMCVPTNTCENLTEWVEFNNLHMFMEMRRMGHGDDHDNHKIEIISSSSSAFTGRCLSPGRVPFSPMSFASQGCTREFTAKCALSSHHEGPSGHGLWTWVFDNSALPGEDPIEFADVMPMMRRQFVPGVVPPGPICMPRAYCVVPRLPGLKLEGKFDDDETWGAGPAPFDAAQFEFIPFNESARSSCAPGYMGGTVIGRCTETCTMSPPVTSCTVQQCTDISTAFDLASIHATVSTTAPTPIDEQVLITCAEGYALSPDHTPATVALPAVDGGETVELVEQQTFTAPSPDVSSTVQLTGANPVKIDFPAGAWPAGETRQLKVTVVKIQKGGNIDNVTSSSGLKIAGSLVLFEPSGVTFSKPVKISVPYNTSVDYGSMSLRVFRWTSGKWVIKPVAAGSPGVTGGQVEAETMSFSLYAALAVPPVADLVTTPAPATTTTPAPTTIVATTTPAPEWDNSQAILGGIIGGSIGGALVLAGLGYLIYRNYKSSTEPLPSQVPASGAAPRGIDAQGKPVTATVIHQPPGQPPVAPTAPQVQGGQATAYPMQPQGASAYPMQQQQQQQGGVQAQPLMQQQPQQLAPAMPSNAPAAAQFHVQGQGAAASAPSLGTPGLQPPSLGGGVVGYPSASQQQPATSPYMSGMMQQPQPQGIYDSQQAQGVVSQAGVPQWQVGGGGAAGGGGGGAMQLGGAAAAAGGGGEQQRGASPTKAMLPDVEMHTSSAPAAPPATSNLPPASPTQAGGGPSLVAWTPPPRESSTPPGETSTPAPKTPAQKTTPSGAAMDKSPFDAFSLEDIQSLLPPGWLCCSGCSQPVNATWHKCPKCGTSPK